MKNQVIILFAIIVLLSACKNDVKTLPTPDFDSVRTQAVQTAVMDITAQAVLHPSETPVPTVTSQFMAAILSTEVPGSISENLAGSSERKSPTNSPNYYNCSTIIQHPLDKPQMAGSEYDMVWTIRNTGTAIWKTNGCYVKWLGGSDLSARHIYPLVKDVAPNELIDLAVNIQIQINPTSVLQVTRWGIVNDNGDVFCKFFHAIPSTYPPNTIETPTK
jgi:hypothetical protein